MYVRAASPKLFSDVERVEEQCFVAPHCTVAHINQRRHVMPQLWVMRMCHVCELGDLCLGSLVRALPLVTLTLELFN